MEAPRPTQTQYQHTVGTNVEILDTHFGAERRQCRRYADFCAIQNQAHPETGAGATALAHQIQIAALEHAQAHRSARQQHVVQRKQR